MFIAINRFRIAPGKEAQFEDVWRTRKSHLKGVPGFKTFHLLKGEKGEEATVFLSHSQWDSEQSFLDWTRSEAFRLSHRNAKMPEGILLGHPVFEGYSSVDMPNYD